MLEFKDTLHHQPVSLSKSRKKQYGKEQWLQLQTSTQKVVVSRNSATISDSSTDELRLAATILDECETEGQREEYVKALQKHASVHIYGRCGAPCPGWVTEDCLKYLDQHYKVSSIVDICMYDI